MRISALLIVLLLAFTVPGAAQIGGTTDILRGRVTGEDGQPLGGATVEAISIETGVRRAVLTDRNGRYTILFPDGGGRYQLTVSFIGHAAVRTALVRQADEDLLLADVQLRTSAIEVEGVTAQVRRAPPPGRGETGTRGNTLSGDLTSRLPLEDTDFASLAALTPGVVARPGADSLGGGGSFSVMGQRSSLNQVTLDGASFASMLSGGSLGGSPLGLPQEGVRSTQVVTNTYDVARGQFAGGQVASTSRGGTNTLQGSFNYQLRSSALQGGTGRTAWTDGYAQNRLSGGIGGPIIRNRLHYNASFTAQRRADALFALEPRLAGGFADLGIHADSAARFLGILGQQYGVPMAGQTGAYDRTGDALSSLVRVDYSPVQRHNLSVRGYFNVYDQQRAFIRPLEVMENGGEMATRGSGLFATASSRFGVGWINEFRASYTTDRRDLTGYVDLPEGRVRISSAMPDGGTRINTLVFGGDVLPPRASRERTIEVADELSWLLGNSHRLKLGGLFNHSRFSQQSALNRYGTFTFNSLADFEAGRAASYTRSLSERETEGDGWNAALYLGDTWRPTQRLQMVYGLRLERSGFGAQPVHNAAADSAFGLRTDRTPDDVRLSPRLGFSWRFNEQGQPLRLLRGGIGEFRGRTPFSLYAGVLEGADPAAGQLLLSCVGAGRVPAADFVRFRQDAAAIPSTCADGSGGVPGSSAGRNVTAFADGFSAPRSWRGSLGYQHALRPGLTLSLDASADRGRSLYGVRDLNLRAEPAFRIAAEADRPVYAPATAIDAASAITSLQASRRDPRFAHAFELHSELASASEQLTLGLNGLIPARRLSFQTSYTLARSRDQSSFSFGGAQQGFGTVTAGDPNRPGWSASDMDRRHSLTTILGMPVRQIGEVSLIARASSGAPFTPRVGGDINGDGMRNDAAFLFDPAHAPDPALAAGMQRLLESVPGRVRDCLEAQLGGIAERNSCRGDWHQSLDLRSTLRPRVPQLGRRLSLSMDVYNLGAGLDLLLHGSGALRGWGQRGSQDEVLLYPRGFDAQRREFRYEVNEAFGQARSRVSSQRSPFGVQISGRLAIGPDRSGDPLGGFAGVAFGGAGGGGAVTMMRGGGGGGGNVRVMQGGAGGRMDPAAILDRVLPEPISAILELRDSLALSDAQVAQLEEIRTALRTQNDPIRTELTNAFANAAAAGELGGIFQSIGPRVNQGRVNVQSALDRAQQVLTAEQWARVPEATRGAVRQGPGGGGQIRMRRGDGR
jgi:hypothetical protein